MWALQRNQRGFISDPLLDINNISAHLSWTDCIPLTVITKYRESGKVRRVWFQNHSYFAALRAYTRRLSYSLLNPFNEFALNVETITFREGEEAETLGCLRGHNEKPFEKKDTFQFTRRWQ